MMDSPQPHPLLLAAGAATLLFGLLGAAAVASAPQDSPSSSDEAPGANANATAPGEVPS